VKHEQLRASNPGTRHPLSNATKSQFGHNEHDEDALSSASSPEHRDDISAAARYPLAREPRQRSGVTATERTQRFTDPRSRARAARREQPPRAFGTRDAQTPSGLEDGALAMELRPPTALRPRSSNQPRALSPDSTAELSQPLRRRQARPRYFANPCGRGTACKPDAANSQAPTSRMHSRTEKSAHTVESHNQHQRPTARETKLVEPTVACQLLRTRAFCMPRAAHQEPARQPNFDKPSSQFRYTRLGTRKIRPTSQNMPLPPGGTHSMSTCIDARVSS